MRSTPGAAHALCLAAHGVIAGTRQRVSDFCVSVDEESPFSGALGLPDPLLTVRRSSTGVERLYAVADHATWMLELADDLKAGLFDEAARSAA